MKRSCSEFLKPALKIKSLIDLAENTHFIQQNLKYMIKSFSQYLHFGNHGGLRVLTAGFCTDIGYFLHEYAVITTTGTRSLV